MAIKHDAAGLLPPDKDRRRKLTETQRAEIAANAAGLSQRELAALYGVSRRSIQFILDPAKHAANLARRAERGGWRQYYDRPAHTRAMREHRHHRAAVFDGKD